MIPGMSGYVAISENRLKVALTRAGEMPMYKIVKALTPPKIFKPLKIKNWTQENMAQGFFNAVEYVKKKRFS